MSENPYATPSAVVLPAAKQAIWNKELKSARVILIIVGIIQLLFGVYGATNAREDFTKGVEQEVKRQQGPNVILDKAKVDQLFEENKGLVYALVSIPLIVGGYFLVMAALVFKFPVGVTLSSLIVFIAAHALSGYLDPSEIPKGIILKIAFIVILAKAYKSARTARSLVTG